MESLEELDRKTADIRRRWWGGKPLPFPVLLDENGITEADYGISMYPAYMLVDPEGKVVERGDPDRLEAELAKLAAAKKPAEEK